MRSHPLVIPFDDLTPTRHSHEFVGAEHGDAPFSVILVHSDPGVGPKVHQHPYHEVFIIEAGEATFRLGNETVVVSEGHVVVGPPNVAHGFTNTGSGELRLVAIHGHPRFITEWLEGDDPVWRSTTLPLREPEPLGESSGNRQRLERARRVRDEDNARGVALGRDTDSADRLGHQ